MPIIDRNDYVIPFIDVLRLRKNGYALEHIYEVLFYDENKNALETAYLGPYVSHTMAKSIFNAAYRENGKIAIDSWSIRKKS